VDGAVDGVRNTVTRGMVQVNVLRGARRDQICRSQTPTFNVSTSSCPTFTARRVSNPVSKRNPQVVAGSGSVF